MLFVPAISTLLWASLQSANPACGALTSPDVDALLGATTHAMALPLSANAGGSSCMYQSANKVVAILILKQPSAAAATTLWSSKKIAVSGKDIVGWPGKAYAGTAGSAAVVGVVKAQTYLEVKVTDDTQKMPVLRTKLQKIMKGVASRM